MLNANNKEWKATVVFFSVEAIGHVNPFVGIARELIRRKIRTIILTTKPLKSANELRKLGLEVDCCKEEEESSRIQTADNANNQLWAVFEPILEAFRRGPKSAFQHVYTLHGALGKNLDFLIEHHSLIEAKLKSYQPDLIVFDHIVGLPCATTAAKKWVRINSSYPTVMFSCYNDNYVAGVGLGPGKATAEDKKFELENKIPLREKMRRFFAENKAEDWPSPLDLVPTSPLLNIYFGPSELRLDLDPSLKPLPSEWFHLEHTLVDAKVDPFVVPDSLKDQPGKLIYFSLGTLASSDLKLMNKLIEFMSHSPNKFIISKGDFHEQIKLYPNMWGEKYIDQMAVLSVADLFITHGGHNSIIEAFYYGVGGIVGVPVFADQFDCLQRVEDCGFGVRLNTYQCTQEELLLAIDKVLKSEDIRKRMKAISARMKATNYIQIGADKLEELIDA